MSAPGALVLCTGNPDRGDDAAALAAVDALRARLPEAVEVRAVRPDAASLLDAWEGRDRVVVVDAVRSGAEPGTLHRVACAGAGAAVPVAATVSSHDLGVGVAVALGKELGRLPASLVVVGVEAGDTSLGAGLSPAVAAALTPLVEAVAAEVEGGA